MTVHLVKYDAARQALAEAHRVDEAKEIRDKALAVAAYARQAQDGEMILWATEIKLRAERRAGELLRDMAKAGQRQGKGRPVTNGGRQPHLPNLKQLRISADQSKDWQKLAGLPERDFEGRLVEALRDPKTATTQKLLRAVPRRQAIDPLEEERVWDSVAGWLRRVENLPSLDDLKGVRPTGGRKALRAYFLAADMYMKGLMALHREGWF